MQAVPFETAASREDAVAETAMIRRERHLSPSAAGLQCRRWIGALHQRTVGIDFSDRYGFSDHSCPLSPSARACVGLAFERKADSKSKLL
jgi:hypothetical protein